MKLGIAVCPHVSSFPYIVYNGGSMDQALAKCREFGYEGVDLFAGYLAGDEVRALADLFRKHGIEVVNFLPISLSATGSSFSDVVESRRLSYVAGYEREMDNAAIFGTRYMPIGFSRGLRAQDRSWKHYYSTLSDSVERLSEYGESRGVTLCLEPINRFEVNTLNTTMECLEFLNDYKLDRTMLLLDQFHMNIEDSDPLAAIRASKGRIGHFHAADSNRCGAGKGHCDFDALIETLSEIGYDGYLSMEAKPIGVPDACAKECAEFLGPKLAARRATTRAKGL